MGANTTIQWCHATFSPWRGCTKISPGCQHCYAEKQSHRNPAVLGSWGPEGMRTIAAESYWRQPLLWDRQAREAGERRRVFCASLADVFEGPETMHPSQWPKVQAARERLFGSLETGEGLIGKTPNLTWLLLTKRPQNVHRILNQLGIPAWFEVARNAWLGVSVENQQCAGERIPLLLKIPAALRFLSVEPLLGPIRLDQLAFSDGSGSRNALTGQFLLRGQGVNGQPDFLAETQEPTLPRVGWTIVGGESGPKARPCAVEWVRDLVRQCQAAHVPCFVKQLGTAAGLPDKKGGTPSEWPEDLRVRQFPVLVPTGEESSHD